MNEAETRAEHIIPALKVAGLSIASPSSFASASADKPRLRRVNAGDG